MLHHIILIISNNQQILFKIIEQKMQLYTYSFKYIFVRLFELEHIEVKLKIKEKI